MDGGAYIGELCIALEHRWEPEALFVIFTAYLDEADSHGPAPTVIMGGFLGHAYQWDRFGNRLARLQKRYDFRIFHGKDFKAKKGDFAGWADTKCMGLVHDLTDLVRVELTEGLVVHLEHARFMNEYRVSPIPKKMSLDSQYGVCFRACMAHLLEILFAKEGTHRLRVVLERGHRNAGDCERIFNEMDTVLRHQGIEVLGDMTITTKQKASPCMVADFLVGTYSMMRASSGGVSVKTYQAVAPEPTPGNAGLTFLELLPDALRNLKEDWQRNRQRAVDEWRARKAAKQAVISPTSSEGTLS